MIDGDTVVITPPIDGIADVRLIGIDTPEVLGDAEPYGKEASAFTRRVLAGKRVTLEFVVERVDKYGRLLAYVWLPDGTMVNELLVRKGYAEASAHPPNVRYAKRLAAAERKARAEGAGLWGPGHVRWL